MNGIEIDQEMINHAVRTGRTQIIRLLLDYSIHIGIEEFNIAMKLRHDRIVDMLEK